MKITNPVIKALKPGDPDAEPEPTRSARE